MRLGMRLNRRTRSASSEEPSHSQQVLLTGLQRRIDVALPGTTTPMSNVRGRTHTFGFLRMPKQSKLFLDTFNFSNR